MILLPIWLFFELLIEFRYNFVMDKQILNIDGIPADDVLLDKIENIIIDSLSEYHKLEKEIIINAKKHKMEYRFGNERPIAAFMTEKIKNNLNCVVMHEFPIKGTALATIQKIEKEFDNDNVISKISKSYKRYDIDSIAILKDQTIFFEYKTEAKFKDISLLADFIKYKIYTNASKEESFFVYISFEKDPKKITSFIQRKDNYENIDPKKIKFNENASMHVFKNSASKTLTSKKINKYTKVIVGIEVIEKTFDELNSLIENKVEKDFTKELFYKNKNIYGNNVVFSKKAVSNANIIRGLWNILKEKIGVIDNNNENVYEEIRTALYSFKNSGLGKNMESNAIKRVMHQSTNWLLATIEAGMKLHVDNVFEYNQITSIKHHTIDSETFNIEDINNKNEIVSFPPIKEGYKLMVKYVGENIEKEVLKKMTIQILRHLSNIYEHSLQLEHESLIKPFNKKYANIRKKKSYIGAVKKIIKISGFQTKNSLNTESTIKDIEMALMSEIKKILKDI